MKKALKLVIAGSLITGSALVCAESNYELKRVDAVKTSPARLKAVERRNDAKLRKASSLLRQLDPKIQVKWVKGRALGRRIIQING